MDNPTPAEELPSLYRAVLDTVMRLEHVGDRAFAFRVRQDALRTYSTRWDDHGRRALQLLHRKASRRLASAPVAATRTSLAPSAESA